MDSEKIVQKMFAKPVETTIGEVKVWLHPLKYPVEAIVCIARASETAIEMRKGGSDEQDVMNASNIASVVQELMFVVRKSDQPNAERFFTHSKQVLELGADVNRLHDLYSKSFEATEEELGESSRVNS